VATPSGPSGGNGTDIARIARDTGMTLLGLGLLGVQRLQVHRRAIEKQLKERLGPLSGGGSQPGRS